MFNGVVSAIVVCVAVATGVACAVPAVFESLTLDEAIEKSVENGRLLVVDATAEWCGPCKKMDATTWVDPGVVDWLGEHAVAVQIDVDERKAEAERLGIRAMPTVVVFRDGEEFDRSVGYLDADGLLEMLAMWDAGETRLSRLEAAAADGEGGFDIEQRLHLAREYANAGKNAEALEAYVWLWENMVDFEPAYVGVRGSFMAGEMHELAHAYEAATEMFLAMRDALADELRQGAGFSTLSDWVVLNEVVCDTDATLAWFDRVKDRPAGKRAIERLEFRIKDLLIDAGRFSDVGLLYADPVSKARRTIAQLDMMLQMGDSLDMEQYYICEIGDLYAACAAAKRTEEADAICDLLIERFDDAGRIAVVDHALTHGVAVPGHVSLIEDLDDDEARALLKRLREEVDVTDR